jgi:hypothetical protein
VDAAQREHGELLQALTRLHRPGLFEGQRMS